MVYPPETFNADRLDKIQVFPHAIKTQETSVRTAQYNNHLAVTDPTMSIQIKLEMFISATTMEIGINDPIINGNRLIGTSKWIGTIKTDSAASSSRTASRI